MSNPNPTESPRPESLWLATTPTTEYGPLEDGLTVDAAVVGGGITGLSAAIELQDAGRSVAVLEADRIAEGTTGHTTAKLTVQHGLCYDRLVSQFGTEKARQYAAANEAAIETVERRVEALGVDCDVRRTPAYTYRRLAGRRRAGPERGPLGTGPRGTAVPAAVTHTVCRTDVPVRPQAVSRSPRK
ncbi:hypothetical protein HTG_12850 [Natrinema mahii]|nr:hypothetical protein HTG_12850 [Natrinema mahii]